jgi:hypothetical protein
MSTADGVIATMLMLLVAAVLVVGLVVLGPHFRRVDHIQLVRAEGLRDRLVLRDHREVRRAQRAEIRAFTTACKIERKGADHGSE